jgi:hypothetical protein
VTFDKVYAEMISQIDGTLGELERMAENGSVLAEQESQAESV